MSLWRMIPLAAALWGVAMPVYASEVVLHGSTSVTANVIEHHKEEIEKTSGQSLIVVSNGSVEGVRDLCADSAQIGMISAPLDYIVKYINQTASGTLDETTLQSFQVGEARVFFAVNKSNPVKALTRAQIIEILQGKIKNWSELGGHNLPIMVVTERSGGGSRSVVEDVLLSGGSIAANVKTVPNATQIPEVVAQVPVAFGIMSDSLISDSITQIKLDKPLAQPLFYVTKGQPSPEVQAVIDATRAATKFVE